MIATVALRGYDRTTVSRVLSVAGLEEAVFSEHFRDKRDCFGQAVEGLLRAGERAALELFETADPWPERVRAGLALLLRTLADDPAAARVLLVEVFAAGPEMCERRRVAVSRLIALMEEGRGESAGAGQLPAQTSEAIVGGVLSILHRRALQGETAELPALHGDLTYFALLPYVEHRRAAELAQAGRQTADGAR
jgi:AcrR family transcriptional regulator